ncbi:hypothetical protein Tco_1173654 [Tanacetum coccineum]
MLADSKTSDLSTFESVSAFRRSTKVVRNVVLHCREQKLAEAFSSFSFEFQVSAKAKKLSGTSWIEADVPLLGELGAEADEPMVGPIVDEIAEPIVEMEEQVIAPVIDMEEDIAMLFGDDDFSDDDLEGFEGEEEVSDAEVADNIAIGEIGPRVSTVEGQVEQGQKAATRGMSDRIVDWPAGADITAARTHRDVQIQQAKEYGFLR